MSVVDTGRLNVIRRKLPRARVTVRKSAPNSNVIDCASGGPVGGSCHARCGRSGWEGVVGPSGAGGWSVGRAKRGPRSRHRSPGSRRRRLGTSRGDRSP